MKRINTLCALLFLLITSSSAYAGVTDGDVSAYRFAFNHNAVMFTDNPGYDPSDTNAPLGVGILNVFDCEVTTGALVISGLTCNGTSGNSVSDYSCDLTSTPNASDTTWCLFSENPRTGSKAWAVKYENGLIPTNNGASIVRCKGTDVFYPSHGCLAPPSQISIEGGYIKMDTTDNSAPPSRDCTVDAHYGRMVFDETTELLYICIVSGWISK